MKQICDKLIELQIKVTLLNASKIAGQDDKYTEDDIREISKEIEGLRSVIIGTD